MQLGRLELGLLVRGLISLAPSVLKPKSLKRILSRESLNKSCPSSKGARYCYSVWLRHLVMAHGQGVYHDPRMIVELGPGSSLGVGLAALLSGAEHYFSVDAVQRTSPTENVETFEELVNLYRDRSPIPGDGEFPRVTPKLNSYDFPSNILPDDHLRKTLDQERTSAIRQAIVGSPPSTSMITYVAPWDDPSLIEASSVDMVVSQAVMEHVTDIGAIYRACHQWLKPGGIMTHSIDFKCHATARQWNGHWTYPNFVWKIILGRRPYLINRMPYSAHHRVIESLDFDIVFKKQYKTESKLSHDNLAKSFKKMSLSDLHTSEAYLIAVKHT